MKRIVKSFAIAAVSALAFISCSQEQNPVSKDNGIHFTIRTSENPLVKSFIESNLDGTYTPKWSKGDELAMFVGAINDNSKPTATLTNSNEKGLTAKFDGQVTGIEGNGTFKSFAPARAFAKGYSNGNVGITLAETQKPSSLTIDEACDILVAKETSYMADATGKVEIVDLFFKRMFSVVKVALTGPESLKGQKISKFSLTAPEGTVLTGRAAIDLTTATIDKWNIDKNSVTATYEADAPVFGGASGLENAVWLVVNPCTVASGAKVVFAGETANYTFSKEVTLSKDLTFPASQLAVINLTLAEENCTKKAAASWIATDLADITATDEVVITMAKGESVYALSAETDAKSNNPQAVLVTVKNGELTAAPADNLVWNIANDKGNLTIYPNGQTDKWLFAVSGDTKVKVGNSTTNKIFTLDATTKYLKNTGANRYLGVYNNADWRCYTSTSTNIGGQTLCFYVKGTPKTAIETPANLQVSAAKVVSWDAVSGAASYNVTIGTKTYTSNTNSYDAAAIADDYYDVAVVAVPSDKENYKNSAAATLTGVKFGTPTLATPTLKEGVIDGASISVSWSVDERATAGYNCELFKGGVKVGESKTVKAGAVTFTGLDAETAYVVKVNAIAVEGAKAYAASPVATLDVTTKAASATANDGSLERPYTAAEAIAAIDANNIDLTGKHVKGVVTEVVSHNTSYGSMVYIIKSGEKTLKIFNGYDFGQTKFLGTDDLKVGDEVVVFGDLIKYNNTTYELNTNNYLISINGETQIYRGLAVSGQKTAFTVGDTFEFGGKALQVWRGKADVDVTASATFSGYNMSTEGKQTVTVTVGDESVTYVINVRAAGGEAAKTYTLTFGKEFSDPEVKGYKDTWDATRDGFTWTMANWNNNNAYVGTDPNKPTNWTYIRAGSKQAASVATITTKGTVPEAISTVTMTIDAITATYVNSIKLEVLSGEDGVTVKETVLGTAKQGDCVFKISNPQQDCKYKITVDCKKNTAEKGKNGFVQVSKVVYANF